MHHDTHDDHDDIGHDDHEDDQYDHVYLVDRHLLQVITVVSRTFR